MSSHATTDTRMMELRGNTLTPFLRVRLSVRGGALTVEWTDAVLGLVPFRRRRQAVPVGAVARSIRLHPRIYPDRLAAALVPALAVVFDLVTGTWWRIAALLLSGALLVLSYVLVLTITPDGAAATHVPVCWLLRRRIAGFLAAETGR